MDRQIDPPKKQATSPFVGLGRGKAFLLSNAPSVVGDMANTQSPQVCNLVVETIFLRKALVMPGVWGC